MIRYPITRARLDAMIKAADKGWLADADKRTATFRKLGYYKESKPNWSKIKPVYMRLQGEGKCVFCEREMESVSHGTIEQDVEHFRPKSSIKAWPVPKVLKSLGIPFGAVPAAGKGYYLLPYHPLNYAAACKPCNSVLKKDYFPIAGVYQLGADDPTTLKGEKAYLIYPIGSFDEDPERLIEFRGTSPRPVSKSGHQRNRALVTIAFFGLDDPEQRKNLYRDRALVIMALFPLLQKTQVGTADEKAAARATVDGFLKPRLRHLNCAKSFKRLFEADPVEAQAMYDGAVKLMTSIS